MLPWNDLKVLWVVTHWSEEGNLVFVTGVHSVVLQSLNYVIMGSRECGKISGASVLRV